MLTFQADGSVQDLGSTRRVLGGLVLSSRQARQHDAAFRLYGCEKPRGICGEGKGESLLSF